MYYFVEIVVIIFLYAKQGGYLDLCGTHFEFAWVFSRLGVPISPTTSNKYNRAPQKLYFGKQSQFM